MDGVLPFLVVISGALIGSFTDLTRFKVYNVVTFPIFFGGITYGLLDGGWNGLLFALAGSFIGLGVLLIPYLMGGLGAGDVKFVMAMGSWIGVAALLPAILVGCGVLILYYFIVIARRQGIGGLSHNIQLMMMRLSCFGRNLALNDQFESVQTACGSKHSESRGRLIPFSAMMSIGILIVLIITKFTASVGH